MKLSRFLPLLLLAVPAFALDEYQPAEEGLIAVDMDNSLDWGRGSYDENGSLKSPEGSPLTWSPSVQLRMGLPNLTEISVVLPMAVMNSAALQASDWDWGFYESSLGFKLGIEDWGVAVVGGVQFPLGSRNIIGDDLRWHFTVGGIGHWQRKNFLFDGSATWTATPANDKGIRRGDLWEFIARPQYKLDSTFTPYVGLVTDLQLPGKINDKRDGVYSHVATIQPGTFIQLGDEWVGELQAPVTLLGDYPQSASVGVYVGLTLLMGP